MIKQKQTTLKWSNKNDIMCECLAEEPYRWFKR